MPPIAALDHPRLALAWRRRFVMALALAAFVLLITRSLAGIPPLLRHGGGAASLTLAIVCLWFILDSIRPWVGGEDDREAAQMRALAGSRAHAALVRLAAGGWLYMWAAGISPIPIPPVTLDLSEVLVGFFLAGLFLPVAFAAWNESEGTPAVGPAALIRSRFAGDQALGHWISAGLFALCAALAVFAASPVAADSAAGRAFLLAAVALIVVAAGAILWLWGQIERRRSGNVQK